MEENKKEEEKVNVLNLIQILVAFGAIGYAVYVLVTI